jgi:hypothetical protein
MSVDRIKLSKVTNTCQVMLTVCRLVGCAGKQAATLWPELSAHVRMSDLLLIHCGKMSQALENAARHHEETCARALVLENEKKLKSVQSDAETQTEKDERGPTKYWNEGFEMELQALKLKNVMRMTEAGLQHKDQRKLLGEKVWQEMEELRKGEGERGKLKADVLLYKNLANDLGQSIEQLVHERHKMLDLIHSLSLGNPNAVKAKGFDSFRNKAVQTEALETENAFLAELEGDGNPDGSAMRIPAAWRNAMKKWPNNRPKMPLPVFQRLVNEVLQEMRRVISDKPDKPFPELVSAFLLCRFGFKILAETRLNDFVAAALEYREASELARIFIRLSGLFEDYDQDAVMLLSAGYDALERYADGKSTSSRSWFDLNFTTRVILADCLLVMSRLFQAGSDPSDPHNLSEETYKKSCALISSLSLKAPSSKDTVPNRANRTGYKRYMAVMNSRVANPSLGPSDKTTVDVEQWLGVVLDTTIIFLKEQEDRLIDIFKRFDTDGDGNLSLQEFMSLVESISSPPTTDQARMYQTDKAIEAFAKMLNSTPDGSITPKVFAKQWRTEYLSMEKDALSAVAKHKTPGEHGIQVEEIQESHQQQGNAWDIIENHCSDLEWDLEQFLQVYSLPSDNIFTMEMSELIRHLRNVMEANKSEAIKHESKTGKDVSSLESLGVGLGHAQNLLKDIKSSRIKAERFFTRFKNIFARRPGHEERVQVSLSVMSYFFVLEDGVN